jgi:hypothetical protein
MIKYAHKQFFLGANELHVVNSLQSKNSKSYWTLVKLLMKGTGNNYTIPPLYNGSSGELVYEDKTKAGTEEELFVGILNHIIDFIPLRFIFLQRLIRLISPS